MVARKLSCCPHKHFIATQSLLTLPGKLFAAPKIILKPRKHFVSPRIFCGSCANFLFLAILGMPECRDCVKNQLMVASAL